MKHAPPAPPELGSHGGLAYALFLPEAKPEAGVVILHGAGAAKESHFDFARLCRDSGLAALAFDARGHGRSEGAFGPGAIDDVLAMCELMRSHAPRVALRGSSMGGFCAVQAAGRDPSVCAVVAICPAPEDLLLRGLRSEELQGFEADRDALEPWLEGLRPFRGGGRAAPGARPVRGGWPARRRDRLAPAPRARGRADPLHGQRGAVRRGARAQAAAD